MHVMWNAVGRRTHVEIHGVNRHGHLRHGAGSRHARHLRGPWHGGLRRSHEAVAEVRQGQQAQRGGQGTGTSHES